MFPRFKSRLHTSASIGTLTAATITVLIALWLSGTAKAQSPWVSPYPMRLTPARVRALVQATDRRLGYMPGEVIIKFRDRVSVAQQQRALAVLRSRPSVNDLRWAGPVAVLTDPTEPDATVLAAALRRQPEVAFAEPNYIYRTTTEPNDPGFSSAQWNFKAIDMPRAWDINPGGNGDLVVAVLDTGITTVNQTIPFPLWNGTAIEMSDIRFSTNPDMSSARLISPKDFVFWDGPVLDMVGHGTHVGSTIGEDTNNGLALAGIAYNTKIMPVKVCLGFWELQFMLSSIGAPGTPPLDAGGCPGDVIIQGIRYAADNGAKIINMSLGGESPSEAVQDAIEYAISKGVFVAMAGGNAFEDGNPVEYPASYAAELAGAMAVGAVGPSLTRSFYSGTASNIEVAAPGGNFREGGAQGGVWQSTIFPPDSDVERVLFPRFDRYADVPYQGTSMATPHVAAIAALIMSQGVTKPVAVEALIKATARDLGVAGRDSDYGFGLVQPRAALRGFGFINK